MNANAPKLTERVRVPLHELQADVDYLIGRVVADGSCATMIASSIKAKLNEIEGALMLGKHPMADDRAKLAYDTFRGGFREIECCPAPSWDDAPSWVRDVVLVAYLQGTLDGRSPSDDKCIHCNGTGRHQGMFTRLPSPACVYCNGTGKER